MKKYFLPVSAAALFLFVTAHASAAEIQYGHVEEVHGNELHIQYKGPGGEQNFLCDAVSSECESFGTTTPTLFPEIDGESGYADSPDGRLGIVKTATEAANGSTTYTHTIYDISGAEAEAIDVVPYKGGVSTYKFPWANDHVVLFGTDGTVVTYDIETEEMQSMEPSQSEFPLRSLSPHATYLSAYNYVDEAHKLWHTTSGEEVTIPSETPAFVEFSQDEQHAAFIDDRDGYQSLYVVDLTADRQDLERIFPDGVTIEDYLWFRDDLYAVGNTADNPYRWVLHRYDPETEERSIVSEQVSYGDYIRPIGDLALSFLTIDGKNTHVSLYEPEYDRLRTIAPVEPSPASDQITRSVMSFDDGARGVLYEPDDPDRRPELFIWLHGGPKRQTSFGYHSYLSYAVYDELLERLAESGAYVLKLDYAGSYGHGNELMDALTDNLGDADVAHVVNAAHEVQDEYDIDDTYLIGNSYGGYLGPKVLAEEPHDFAGAIAINGVFDWFTLLERIPSSPFKTYFKGLVDLDDLDANFELYEQASIVKGLPDLDRKELLLIYGEDDATVPTWQTREFFYQAESLGKNVNLLKLEGEGHIIRERESLNRVCEFIDNEILIDGLVCE